MGFVLEDFFEELYRILTSDVKASKKVGRLHHAIDKNKKYAMECGAIPRINLPKNKS